MNDSELKWYRCPRCGQKLFQISEDAHANGIHVKCKLCKKIIHVNL